MSRKVRARIARENGAKSHGPITAEGKAASSQNANKSEKYAQILSPFLGNETRAADNSLLKELIEIYRPLNQLAAGIVQEITTARWQVDRLNDCLSFQWNRAIADSANTPSTVAPELAEIETMARSAEKLYTSGAVAHRINRQIDQLELRIARLERRIKFVHANFPTVASQPAETKTQINEPTVHITENNPDVIKTCKQQVPPLTSPTRPYFTPSPPPGSDPRQSENGVPAAPHPPCIRPMSSIC